MNSAEKLEPEKISGNDYFEQIFPVAPVVCGRQLRPLSLGGYRMMAHFKVAFVSETEREATPGDLLVGVLICSMSAEEFLAFASQPDFQKQIQKWGRKVGFFEPLCYSWPLIGWKLRQWLEPAFADTDFKYLSEQIEIFQKYVVESSRAPEFWDESPDSKVSAAHWSQSVEVTLRGALNWSEKEIESAPLGKALWDYFKHFENLGLVRLMTKEESAEIATPLTPEQQQEAREKAEKVLAYIRQQQSQPA